MRTPFHVARAVLLAALLVSLTGCTYLGTGLLSFAAGALFDQLRALSQPPTVVIDRQCFRNGEPIDCALFDELAAAGATP